MLDSENRRFWPVRVGQVDIKAIEQNRDQLWAEIAFYFKRGDPWWL
ncbi:MAG: VapE domain-containing protein, partial [Terriglobales bacterium]